MVLDQEVDAAYPARWLGKVTVETVDGRILHGRVEEPKGDPGNTLSREELEQKALRLAEFSGAATEPEMRAAFERIRFLLSYTKYQRRPTCHPTCSVPICSFRETGPSVLPRPARRAPMW